LQSSLLLTPPSTFGTYGKAAAIPK